MSDAVWFYAREGQHVGPMSLAELRGALAQRQLLQKDLVWRDGMNDWAPAESVPELMPVVQRSGGPPPLPNRVASLGYYAPPPPAEDIGQNAGLRMLIPVGRSPWAIVAGYLGLFSLLIIPAPFAVIVSIMAIRDIRRHPDRHGMGRAIFGLAMGGLVVIGVIAAMITRL